MTTLAARFMPVENAVIRNVMLAVGGSLLVAAAAQVSIPFWPVPMTLQSLAVLLVGGAFGARLGAATIALYALEGAVGLPFFSHGNAGLTYLLHGTTTGYIIGFAIAAYLMGIAAERGLTKSPVGMSVAGLMASLAIYLPGLIWLSGWFAVNKAMPAGEAVFAAVMGGFVPFVTGDILKALVAGLGLSAASKSR